MVYIIENNHVEKDVSTEYKHFIAIMQVTSMHGWRAFFIWTFSSTGCGRKVKNCAFIVRCPFHHLDRRFLKNMKVIFFLANCSHRILVWFIIWKGNSRQQFAEEYIGATDRNQDFKISLLRAIHLLTSAWNNVARQTVITCFGNAGFSAITCTPRRKWGRHASIYWKLEPASSRQENIMCNMTPVLQQRQHYQLTISAAHP